MATLPTDLRSKLERVVIDARDAAEAGARAALEALAVHHHEPYPHMKPAERELRNHLRARARQLGDRQDKTGKLTIDHLANECAYEHWHRMLFARFLAENNLLIEPDEKMPISLAEAEELAKEKGEDVWVFASRCAQDMLPQIFRPDDPLLHVSLAKEHRVKLECLLASLQAAAFTASDALGWVYQFWQSKKKDEVNKSEVKIGADEIAAVTQLFTEPYMVEFLLHNTLGAWWAGNKLRENPSWAEQATSEEELRRKVALPGVGWEYLRFVRGADGKNGPWRPAAGTFDGWPKAAKDIKVLDPCCGSGHFLVAALVILVAIRMAEEGLSSSDAIDAVLRDNLYGLEIDERCCQIAAFALALAAWTYPDAGGYRLLPELHIACTGIGPQCTADDWIALAAQAKTARNPLEREMVERALVALHGLFTQAPTLGSLIDPTSLPPGTIAADYETIQPYLAAVLKEEKADDETRERAIAAAGMVKAADLLAGEYTLVITNVPYLGRKSHDDILKSFIDRHHQDARKDLATVLINRAWDWLPPGGTIAVVTRENWLFLTGYRQLREGYLRRRVWNLVARLGPGAFEAISGHVVKASLVVMSSAAPRDSSFIAGLEAAAAALPHQKASVLRGVPLLASGDVITSTSTCNRDEDGDEDGYGTADVPFGNADGAVRLVRQAAQLENPDSRIILEDRARHALLAKYANSWQGIKTSDDPRFTQYFWEHPNIGNGWWPYQRTPEKSALYVGRSEILFWEDGNGRMTEVCQKGASFRGVSGWDRVGIAVHTMGELAVTLYTGEKFSADVSVVDPKDQEHLAVLWSSCLSPEYSVEVRKIDSALRVTNTALVKVPFDFDHWQEVAAEKYPDGLPDPESDDATQWLFHGRPEESQGGAELHVAVARLLGYRWPAELDDKMRLSKRARELVRKCGELAKFADDDGIVCIPAVRGEDPAAERLLELLTACGIEPEVDLDDWLRNSFFEEHCKLFHDRPFVWHIWDGRKRDGFHALVNYHKLCEGKGKGRKLLESLTYSYLGEWITRQKDGVKRGEGGAEDRLAAALALQKRLEMILAGEPPFDIFVRWKPLHEQPIGWEPDINDGVRMIIRPFLASDLPEGKKGAGVLRCKPKIKWDKDRGKEPDRPKAEYPWFWGWDEKTVDFDGGKEFDGNRHNACHYSNKVKQQTRDSIAKG